jgi:hypothetical protein
MALPSADAPPQSPPAGVPASRSSGWRPGRPSISRRARAVPAARTRSGLRTNSRSRASRAGKDAQSRRLDYFGRSSLRLALPHPKAQRQPRSPRWPKIDAVVLTALPPCAASTTSYPSKRWGLQWRGGWIPSQLEGRPPRYGVRFLFSILCGNEAKSQIYAQEAA